MEEITFYQEKLKKVAIDKANPLNDREVYEISCKLDELIVELMIIQKEEIEQREKRVI